MISMTGYKEIDEVIKKLPSQLTHPILQSIHSKAVQPYVRAAYFAAPLLTGKTADSIGVVKPNIRRAGSIGAVGAGPRRGRFGGHVAHLSEFGTKPRKTKSGANRGVMPRKPFLAPAWDRTQNQVREGIKVATGQVIYSFMKRTIKRYG